MKKKIIIIAAVVVCAVLIVLLALSGQKPYKALSASDIVSATVHLAPPDKTIQIADADIEELVSCLNEIVVYNEDNSCTEYSGQAVIFTLTMVDGSQEEITAYYPFVIINGTGYKTKYEPCEKLNNYANKLLGQAK